MDNKKIEVIIIEDNLHVVHRTVSTVNGDSNTFTIAINAIIEALTGHSVQSGRIQGKEPDYSNPPRGDKFAQAVPQYKNTIEEKLHKSAYADFNHTSQTPEAQTSFHNEALAQTQFHPDLVQQGVAPVQTTQAANGAIPMVKLDMKTILKNAGK